MRYLAVIVLALVSIVEFVLRSVVLLLMVCSVLGMFFLMAFDDFDLSSALRPTALDVALKIVQ